MKKTKKTALTAAAFAAAMGMSSANMPASAMTKSYFELRMDAAGDIDGNGELNVSDIIFLYKYLTNQQTMSQDEYYRADVNEDGYVNIFDFIMQKQLLLFYPEVPVPQPTYGPEWATENPTEDIPQPDYGPQWFESSEPIEETDITMPPTEYNPETEPLICVYGPPEYFGITETETEEPDETEPEIYETDTYEPETDFPVEVYGPPEYFGLTEDSGE
ncbi:MAG: dockerin type I repeat-containing protein [Oscillospiraceae bacterium]|nr:dockerin type I repeat-containing protein [Oscillospiraceae bacterium]